jgi:hypothetical protein
VSLSSNHLNQFQGKRSVIFHICLLLMQVSIDAGQPQRLIEVNFASVFKYQFLIAL